ncbi:MAG: tRNA (guanosine(37)-N1)-methyltransferase TrmD [Pseudobutyrivibrio sp.]|nr:tRNA (guanosine(37)-N1)-methyltransferase TrmD [Pseudobutyrivibrio sp.]
MIINVLTLFPEMIDNIAKESIMGKGIENGYLSLNAVNIRDYTTDVHKKVDDYTYGGGAGMLIQAQPVYDCYKAVNGDAKPRTIYVTPQGRPFTQNMAIELSKEDELTIICGHYEGIDERVLEEVVTDYISIGDYVLTGGELAAMVIIDAVSRFVPGVLGNDESAMTESFYRNLLEYPQYSRPYEWNGKHVPEVLTGGNAKEISAWRLNESIKRTKERRPDLYEKYIASQEIISRLKKKKRDNYYMIESLNRGKSEVLYCDDYVVLLEDSNHECYYIWLDDMAVDLQNDAAIEAALSNVTELLDTNRLLVVQTKKVADYLCGLLHITIAMESHLYTYTQKDYKHINGYDIRMLGLEYFDEIFQMYDEESECNLRHMLSTGKVYGIFVENELAGFCGEHLDGCTGPLIIKEKYRKQGLGYVLERYMLNVYKEKDEIMYCYVKTGNLASEALQSKLGLYSSDKLIYWLGRYEF